MATHGPPFFFKCKYPMQKEIDRQAAYLISTYCRYVIREVMELIENLHYKIQWIGGKVVTLW